MKKLFESGSIVVWLGSDCTIYINDVDFGKLVYASNPNASFVETLRDMESFCLHYACKMLGKYERLERYESKRELAARAYRSGKSAYYIVKHYADFLYNLLEPYGVVTEHDKRVYCRDTKALLYSLRGRISYEVFGWLL